MMRRQAPVSHVAQAIRQAVKEHPGIHFRGLGRLAQVTSAGQLRHHLDRLERQGAIVEIEDGRYKRFFVAGEQDPKLRIELARFSRAVPRRIARLLLVNPMNRTELRRSLGCADSTLGYHLTRMVLLGDLARTRGPSSCLYSLTNEETVRKMLLIQGALAEPDVADPTGFVPTEDGDDGLSNVVTQPAPPAAPTPPATPPDLPYPDRPEFPTPTPPADFPDGAATPVDAVPGVPEPQGAPGPGHDAGAPT